MEGILRRGLRAVTLLLAGCVALVLAAAGPVHSATVTGTGLFNTANVPLPGGGSIDLGPRTTFAIGDDGGLEVQDGIVHLAVSPHQRRPVTLKVPGGTVTVRDGEVVVDTSFGASFVRVIAGTAVLRDTQGHMTFTVRAGWSAETAGDQVAGPNRMAPGEVAFRWWETGPPWWLVTLIVLASGAALGTPVVLLVRRRREHSRIRALAAAGLLS